MIEAPTGERKLFGGRKLFVEVGPDINPIPLMGTITFGQDEQYLAIDADIGYYSKTPLKELLDLAERNGKHYEVFNGLVQQMCLPDGCAKTVYLANVLGSYFPRIEPGKNSRNWEAWKETLFASARLVSRDGELIVVENMTPHWAPLAKITLALSGVGLVPTSTSNGDSDIKMFSARGNGGKANSYIARFAYPQAQEL